jgi:hypothetical protein
MVTQNSHIIAPEKPLLPMEVASMILVQKPVRPDELTLPPPSLGAGEGQAEKLGLATDRKCT